MIILFARSYKNWIDVLYRLKRFYPDCYILTRFDKYYFKKADLIIPMTIACQKKLNQYKEFKHKFLTVNDKIYDTLDDKINFYKFIIKHNLLRDYNIKLIPTYDTNYRGSDIYGKFIVKHRNGTGSTKNKIVKDRIKKIIRAYSYNYQIQDLLDVDHINCISCFCKDGSILSCLNFVVPHFISKKLYGTNHRLVLKQPDEKQFDLISNIIKITNYSGFIEFEFLIDKYNQTYLIECNPRISGTIRCMSDNSIPYMSKLVNPYIKQFTELKLDEHKNNYNSHHNQKITYNGKFKHPRYSVSSGGKIHFVN